MQSRWSDRDAEACVAQYAKKYGADLALRTYTSRLLGADPQLVLHGGGNTSVKTKAANILGETFAAMFVKASGRDLASIEPDGHTGLDLESLLKLKRAPDLSDDVMVGEFRTRLLDARSPTPSIETLVHAFLPGKFIDHTHADSILALTNQREGKQRVREALGKDVLVLDYVTPGFKLAKAAAAAVAADSKVTAMVWMHHGLVTWGATAREAYERTIELVTKAEQFIEKNAGRPLVVQVKAPVETASELLVKTAPLVRAALAAPTDNPDRPLARVILQALTSQEALAFAGSDRGRAVALTPPLTTDHLIRTKTMPLWVDAPHYDDPEKLREQLLKAVKDYAAAYEAYAARHAARMPAGVARFDPYPRVVLLPGLGVIAAGENSRAAKIALDIAAHTIAVKSQIAAMGEYEGLPEAELFDMEYRPMQHAKLQGAAQSEGPLARTVALVTGAAGAIGSAISEELLAQGAHVAVTDLPGEALDRFAAELEKRYAGRALAAPLDVTDGRSVAGAFEAVIQAWGGVDALVINAGVAYAAPLERLDLEAFRRLERVNVEGTALLLAEASKHFRYQRTGGDIVLVSTKNVFSPGAQFGAYSATKAAAHQLARIASLELADADVRVNMVAPDAIFSHGGRRSGLWAEVGPERMKARGLDEKGLEEYYRQRNLLKTKVTATHVAKAVVFFLSRQTPTTGATLPVDGGLPDATPR